MYSAVYSVHCTEVEPGRFSPVSRQRPAREEGETGWWRTTVWDISSVGRVGESVGTRRVLWRGECGDISSVVADKV